MPAGSAPRPADHSQDVALLLPGMSLNASVFPDLGISVLTTDFTAFDALTDGRTGVVVMAAYVDALDALTGDPLWAGARRRLVVGHSFGGMLALSWLLHHGGRGRPAVDGVVLIATTPGPMYVTARLRVGRLFRRELRLPIRPLMSVWDHPLVTRAVKRLAGQGTVAGRVDFRTLSRSDDFSVALAGWRNTTWRAKRSFRAAMRGFDVRESLPAISVPTIVLHGTRDTFFRLADARFLASHCPRGTLRIVAGAGHLLPLTHGDAVRLAVNDLLA